MEWTRVTTFDTIEAALAGLAHERRNGGTDTPRPRRRRVGDARTWVARAVAARVLTS